MFPTGLQTKGIVTKDDRMNQQQQNINKRTETQTPNTKRLQAMLNDGFRERLLGEDEGGRRCEE